jgi:beta-lactamase regulating signal transducer with metallopeptidase domain
MIQSLNRFAEGWWQWQAGMLVQVVLLVAFAVVVDAGIRRWAWPRLRHALWLLVLVKLFLPPSLTSPVSLIGRFEKQPEPYSAAVPDPQAEAEVASLVTAPPSAPAVQPTDAVRAPTAVLVVPAPLPARIAISWKACLLGLWALGAVVLSAWLGARLRRFRRELAVSGSDQPPPVWFGRALREVAAQLKLRRIPSVQFTHATASPAVFGLFRPVVLLPATEMHELSEAEVRHILLHELAHIRRGDLVLHAINMALLVLYWHNPLLWLLRRFFQNLRELCCDATVANTLRREVSAYRETLLNTARRLLAQPPSVGLGLLGWFESGRWLGVRVRWLERNTWRNRWLQVLATVCLVLVVAGCVLPMRRSGGPYGASAMKRHFANVTPEAKRVLAVYDAHRQQSPRRYALAIRNEGGIKIAFRDGARVHTATYTFGGHSRTRKRIPEVVAADREGAGETMASMLAWAQGKMPSFVRVSDGENLRDYRADGYGGFTSPAAHPLRLTGYPFLDMNVEKLWYLGWPGLVHGSGMLFRLVHNDSYALANGLVCLEGGRIPSPSGRKEQYPKDRRRPWLTRYYLNPRRSYICQRTQENRSRFVADVTEFTPTEAGGFVPATITKIGSRYGASPSDQTESSTHILFDPNPSFPDGIFDVDALARRCDMTHPVMTCKRVGRTFALEWRSLVEVKGTVVAWDTGKPIPDALVRVSPKSRDMRALRGGRKTTPRILETRSDRTGHFSLQVPVQKRAGTDRHISVDVLAPGFRMNWGSSVSDVWANRGDSWELSIPLHRAKYVAGVALDEGGEPSANVKVHARMTGEGRPERVATTVTDDQGRFEIFDFLPKPPRPGQKGELGFEHPAAAPQVVEGIYQMDDRALAALTVTMARGLRISGMLLRADGTPATATRVLVANEEGRRVRSVTTDASGHFQVLGLAAGRVVVHAHGGQLREKCVRPVSLSEHDQDLTLRMQLAPAPKGLKTFDLLGLRVADVTPELQKLYDLRSSDGVVVIAPGTDHEWLGIGPLAEGYCFRWTGRKRVRNTSEMVEQVLAAANAPWGEPNVFNPVQVNFTQGRGRHTSPNLVLTQKDVAALRALSIGGAR